MTSLSIKPALTIHDLCVSYQDKPVLWHINARLPKGKIIGIIGPNGAGKSTLLKACMQLIPITKGKIYFDGQSLSARRKKVSYIPQHSGIDWHFPITVKEVAMMGRYPHLGLFKRPRLKDKKIVGDALIQLGIDTLANRPISTLSGGQRQRVLLARSLAQEAEIYLMDEPFNGVDTATEKVMLDVFKTMVQAGKTVIMIHHALDAAHLHFDWCVLLNKHVVATGPMSNTFTPSLLQQTYGGNSAILNQVTMLLQQKGSALREVH